MKLFNTKKFLKILIDLRFAIFLLFIIAIFSSIGSFIEQDESINFYEQNYPSTAPIYGFIDSKFLLFFGLDHVYKTPIFLISLFILGLSLTSCSITRQFPMVTNSKKESFPTKNFGASNLPFFVNIKNNYFLNENLILKIQQMNFYIYQKNKVIYAYKGLIGRISPILVHISLILILLGASIGSFTNIKAQEVLPKGEIFKIQNIINIGSIRSLPNLNIRVNDFWIEYQKKKVRQFYSNLSILDSFGNEVISQTISVNNPLKYQFVDFYQSDWNLVGIRVKNENSPKILEYPLFSFKESSKTWITWIQQNKKVYTLVFDQLQNTFLIYDENGKFISQNSIQEKILDDLFILELLPSSGILIKSDPSIPLIYIGFLGLMLTTLLSYLPYNQVWISKNKKYYSWIGAKTNRGKIQLEISFENFIRELEKNQRYK